MIQTGGKWFLYGVSATGQCDSGVDDGSVGTQMNVLYYKDWIKQHMGRLICPVTLYNVLC